MGTQVEIRISEIPQAPHPPQESSGDPYRGVVLVLLGATLLGTVAAFAGGEWFANRVLFEVAITLGLASGVLLGVALAQRSRGRLAAGKMTRDDETLAAKSDRELSEAEEPRIEESASSLEGSKGSSRIRAWLTTIRGRLSAWLQRLGPIGIVRVSTAALGVAATIFLATALITLYEPPTLPAAGIGLLGCLIAAGLAAAAARYLGELDSARLPEAPGLTRGARLVGWIFVLAGVSVVLEWAGQNTVLRVLDVIVIAVNVAICYGLFAAKGTATEAAVEAGEIFPMDLAVLYVLGSRTNILGSILDAGEQQLGIDLRSTWALTVVRQSIEPLLVGLLLLGWLSTSLTVVGLQEEGLVERFGVPLAGQPLSPGLHLHLPWPIDQVFRLPVLRVEALSVGHEGQEEGGPENVLWAVEHAANEYTLVLGNGRDLITIDAAVQYRINDPRAWRYRTQNPEAALKAIAYRAVMRNTVNRTLDDALSENIAALSATMRQMIQKDADDMGLGVQVVGFTIGGMHPPVMVADAYEKVVSAEIGKVTAVVNAQAFRNQAIPDAEAMALQAENNAKADGAQALGVAAGQAWAFRGLEGQYRAAPEEYRFRQRLEALEKALADRHITIVDSRFLRDGGELWLTQ